MFCHTSRILFARNEILCILNKPIIGICRILLHTLAGHCVGATVMLHHYLLLRPSRTHTGLAALRRLCRLVSRNIMLAGSICCSAMYFLRLRTRICCQIYSSTCTSGRGIPTNLCTCRAGCELFTNIMRSKLWMMGGRGFYDKSR